MSKASFKTLIKETRKLFKISNLEKIQIYRCIDNVIDFLRSSQINENQVKVCSSFLSTFMHLLKSFVNENKIIEEDDEEEYSVKLSTLLSYYIDSEVKQLKINIKDHSKLNPEKIFVDKVIAKCRVYDRKNENLTVKSFGRFFGQNEFNDIFNHEEVKSAFNILLKKILNLNIAPRTINNNDLFYHQILSVWHKISDDIIIKEYIEKHAQDHNLKIECFKSPPENNLQTEINLRNNEVNMYDDIFECVKENEYLLNDLEWISKLVKIPYKADATVDLTVDSDDSDIEIELPPPAELINVDDDEQEGSLEKSFHDLPSLHSPRTNLSTNSSNNNRICIQERRDYLVTLKDSEDKPSFSVLRRRSIMLLEEERMKAIKKRCKELKDLASTTSDCHVTLWKIPENELDKFRRGKLKISYFIRKYGNNEVRVASLKRKKEQSPKKTERPQVAKKSSTPNISSHHHLSVEQVLGKKIISSTPNRKHKNNSRMEAKICNGNIENNSISISNASHDGLEWPISDHPYAHSPWIDPSLNIEVNNSEAIHVPQEIQIQPAETFDNVSKNEQKEEAIVNTDLLEEILGSRASNYLPEVCASMNSSKTSNVSTSQGEEIVTEIPKKRKYTKRIFKSIDGDDRPKRVRKVKKFEI